MKKEHKEYRKLSKEARKAKERKWEYMSSINEEYKRSVDLYKEVR
jgi:hypothetical protein